jgi:D-3-phosphoglycerate dehydrogenase
MSFRILIPQPIAREGVEELLIAGLEVVEPPSWDVQTLKSYIRDCQGILVRTVSLPGEILKNAPGLRVISRHGVGLDNIDLQYCREHGIQVTNLPEANTVSVAEHTIGMILSITKNFTVCDRETRRGKFDARNQYHGIELEGKTLGVVGLGRIGRLVAQKAVQGFGMRVVAFDPYLPEGSIPGFVEPVEFDTLLVLSDVVTLHVPLVEGTANLIRREQISKMKDGAYLVNCARGGIVDETALEEALRSGKLAAAALDVFKEEPTLGDHPLWTLDNILVTPHMAALTREAVRRMAVDAAQEIISVARGEEPRWSIDLARPQSKD